MKRTNDTVSLHLETIYCACEFCEELMWSAMSWTPMEVDRTKAEPYRNIGGGHVCWGSYDGFNFTGWCGRCVTHTLRYMLHVGNGHIYRRRAGDQAWDWDCWYKENVTAEYLRWSLLCGSWLHGSWAISSQHVLTDSVTWQIDLYIHLYFTKR